MKQTMDREEIRRQLRFYQDLGIKTVILPPGPARAAAPVEATVPPAPQPTRMQAQPPRMTQPHAGRMPAPAATRPVPPPAPVPQSTPMSTSLLPIGPENDSLVQISSDIGDCRRCRLCEQRNKIVFGVGNPEAKLVFVGEGPGADEDAQGIPFVGRAGQLLTQMIEGTAAKEGIAIRRPDVYICNVVKCRPPENRTPLPDEMEICGQFLFRQLMTIKPKAIVCLGATAARALLGAKEGITKMRGNWHTWRDIRVMPTYHPSYLLRPYNQNAKREAWEDLKKVLHYVYD